MDFREIVEALEAMKDGDDEEVAHSRAEDLLLMALRHAGHPEIVDAFIGARGRVGFWYA